MTEIANYLLERGNHITRIDKERGDHQNVSYVFDYTDKLGKDLETFYIGILEEYRQDAEKFGIEQETVEDPYDFSFEDSDFTDTDFDLTNLVDESKDIPKEDDKIKDINEDNFVNIVMDDNEDEKDKPKNKDKGKEKGK